MRKKACTIILTAALTLVFGMPVIKGEAADISEVSRNVFEEISPRYEEIDKLKTLFDISGTKANMAVNVSCSSSKKISIKIVFQRKDGDSWTKVQQWIKEGTGSQILSKSMTVTNGKKYRMKYTVTAGSETVTGKTAAKTA